MDKKDNCPGCRTTQSEMIRMTPGKVVREYMEQAGLSMEELASRAGLSRDRLEGMLEGGEPLTPDMAAGLEKVFGRPERFWLNLEKNFRKQRC